MNKIDIFNEEFIKKLIPINIIEENDKKRLSLSMNLFKICNNFPKEEIGKMKKIQKKVESDYFLSNGFSIEKESSKILLNNFLSKRAATPARSSNYIKFITKSLILSLKDENFKIQDFFSNEDYCFIFKNEKYKISSNPTKDHEKNEILIDYRSIFDENFLLKEDSIFYIKKQLENKLSIKIDNNIIEKIQNCINKVINNHKALYSNENIIELDKTKESFHRN